MRRTSRLAAQLESALKGLTAPHGEARECWSVLDDFLTANYEQFAAGLDLHIPDDRVPHFLALLLVSVGRAGFKNSARRERIFTLAESMGIHLMPVHFYSPVPDTTKIPESVWTERVDGTPGLRFQADSQLRLLRELGAWSAELDDIPENPRDSREFSWNNPAFCPGDAAVYYSMIRHFKPKNVLEVGAGFSTLLACRAALRNGDTAVSCIEPYPLPFLKEELPGLSGLRQEYFQNVPLSEFEGLGVNDILFIDSSHVSKIGSDVNHLFFHVLPRLNPGVIVHVHDIFLPWEVSREWVREKHIFWNEQYLLLAFLLFNTAYEVLLGNQFLAREHDREFSDAFPRVRPAGGGSFWMRRV